MWLSRSPHDLVQSTKIAEISQIIGNIQYTMASALRRPHHSAKVNESRVFTNLHVRVVSPSISWVCKGLQSLLSIALLLYSTRLRRWWTRKKSRACTNIRPDAHRKVGSAPNSLNYPPWRSSMNPVTDISKFHGVLAEELIRRFSLTRLLLHLPTSESTRWGYFLGGGAKSVRSALT